MTDEQQAELERIRSMLEVRMGSWRSRYEHSLGVAETARHLADVYGVDGFEAAAAGLIHDWDKVLDGAELLARAARYAIPIAGSPSLALGLLHGPVAARELPEIFPSLPPAVFQAVERHTVGACDMSPLDMVVFVADAIEPGRRGDYAVRLRELVGTVSLEELFFECFSQGLVYVISRGRYLYPTAASIYNHHATKRQH
ncbi:MAG: bis(5'-nucleosyl)-tetraphosphatase (symmetrical) YqeK [Collinsella sp.]|nr:bis(5'-nucleosyl)-tetraphosphatase (symmetrical) YqeK [Collinsella sp.]